MLTVLYEHVTAWRGWRRVLAAILCGVLAALALPPWYLLPLLVPAFVGLAWLLDGALARPRPLRAAGWAGWWFGFGYFALGLHWIVEPFLVDVARHGWMVPVALPGMAGGLALFPAAAAVLTVAATRRFALPRTARVLMLALAWVMMEWLRGWILTGFPWNLAGYAWGAAPAMIQLGALTGIFGISLLTVAAAAMPAVLAGRGSQGMAMPVRRGWLTVGVVTVALPALALAWGAFRLATAPDYDRPGRADLVEGVRLRIVQANIPQKFKWRRELRAEHMQKHIALSRIPAPEAPTHIIWPETAVPYFLANDAAAREIAALAAPPGGALLAGTPRRAATGPGDEPRFWNASVAITADGGIAALYDKAHLVPFGEYVPLRGILPIDKLVAGQGDFTPGPGPQTLTVPGAPPVSPLICYEAIFPAAVVGKERPGWLLNQTNDAWFGSFAGPRQHFAIAAMRAVEQGLPLVRAANTGISAIVDPYGRVLRRLDLGEEGIIDGALPRALPEPTPYARWGNTIPALLFAGVAFAAALLARAQARR